ncbi:unnamed protein product [Effrenium voratum]|uniref:Cytochrome b5 heme-binding domain-containing protein n=1 Tax=Effrenium voratum TaxID=2562239 RepID=A0AA36J2H5_9DINO|nr:unnamed protein product [Effrenium voratum]
MPLVMPALRKPYTVEEVMKHNTPSSLWVIMNRKVYDVTAFHKKHPGGPGVLLQMGGKDATAAAAAAHKSILPANLMWEFCVGYIVRVKPQEEEKKVTKANSASSDPAPKAQVKKQKKAAAAEEQQADAADREKRRSPPAFVADVEKILSRPVTASQMRSQDSMEKLKSKAQGDMMPHSDGSPPAEDGKLERTFTTIMEEMESELVALSDEEAVKKEPAVPSGGLLCFLNSGCWSTGTTPNQRVPVIGKA